MKESIQRENIMFVLHNFSMIAEINEAVANSTAAYLVKWLEKH